MTNSHISGICLLAHRRETNWHKRVEPQLDVRFGSLADSVTSPRHVRFAPNSDRKSGHRCGRRLFQTNVARISYHRRCLRFGRNGAAARVMSFSRNVGGR